MDLDLVQAVARVGDFVHVQQTTGHEVAGRLAMLSMTNLVLEVPGTGAKHAVALASIISVTIGPAPAAVTVPPAAAPPPPHPVIQPAPAAKAPYVFPRLIVPPGAATVLAQRMVTPPDFAAYTEDELLNAAVHETALARVHQQFDYAVRVKELDLRFGRCAAMASELDGVLRAEPHSTGGFRAAGYLHCLADHAVAASDRYLAAALMAPDAPSTWWLDTAITALRAERPELAQNALLRYLDGATPEEDADAWWALLALSEKAGAANLLHLVRAGAEPTTEVRRSVLEACHSLATAVGDTALVERAARLLTTGSGLIASPLPLPAMPKRPVVEQASVAARPTPSKPRVPPPPPVYVTKSASQPTRGKRREFRNDYERAKYLEQRTKDFEGAKRAYREAIRKDINTASAVKDLAWLTRRTDGPVAALRVIEEEFGDRIPRSAALEQILIDFYMGAGRYEDALRLLEPLVETDLAVGQQKAVLQRICQGRFALAQDATVFAQELMRIDPADGSARRTYAIALMRRADSGDLDLAEEVIEPLRANQDAQAMEIAESIRQIRAGRRRQRRHRRPGAQALGRADGGHHRLRPVHLGQLRRGCRRHPPAAQVRRQ